MRVFVLALSLLLLPLGLLAQTENAATQSAVEPLVRVSLEPETGVVGQPMVLRISILVPTWLPQPPAFPSMEAPNVITRLPERASGPISESVNGETWSGVSRAYRLYPMLPGEVSLPAQSITVTYADPDTTQPVTYEAPLEPIRFQVRVPEGAEGLDPLILASGFTLEQSIEGADGPLGQGEAATRTVTARIEGTSPLFIPPLLPGVQSDAVKAYPRDPVVRETEERGVLSGSRTEVETYVAQYGGAVDLQAIALDWFNTDSGKVETARLEGARLEVDAPAAPALPKVTPREVAMLVGAGLLFGLLLWAGNRWLLPPLKSRHAERRAARLASEGFAAHEVARAIAQTDLSGVVTALALWSQRCPGDEDALEPALAAIGAERFGRGGGDAGQAAWQQLRVVFEAERKRRLHGTNGRGALPPLNPS
ncbi:BatD family protein [Aliiruegeria lutimaris]|uniref:Oxygen tolerance n=1 Tax=Aliiruegeria lutimaris TaxID=571298 RepID=A0A1G8KQ62_9RHOB|nr:BatD family protein [Aliiruegeria lutimaris]SDI45533.1 Oxygen tolerance [Aliiruegeria lutimaris]